MIKLFRIIIVCIVTVMVACTTDESQPESHVVDAIPQTENSSVLKGTTKQLAVINTSKDMVWSSDDASIATVDNNGLVTGVALGEVSIKATTKEGKTQRWTLTVASQPAPGSEFITTWEGKVITIPTFPYQPYNYNVDWDNDGIVDETGIVGDITHEFKTSGPHTIRISGVFPLIAFFASDDVNREKIRYIDQWGTNEWITMDYVFYFCKNLEIRAKDTPDLKKVASTAGMFYAAGAGKLDADNWDVSNVSKMAFMFNGSTFENINVGNWDVSNVTDMDAMFSEAKLLNPDVSKWDVSKVISMDLMFEATKSANPDVSNWDVSNVISMADMFGRFENATPDVNNWNVSNVTDMAFMFNGANLANPDVSRWDVSKVTDMRFMFDEAISANPDVGNWNVSNVTNMTSMFNKAELANPDVSNWDVSNVTSMRNMFDSAISANPDVSNWKIANVKNMRQMFTGATSFTNANYEKLLISFANQPHQKNVVLDADVTAVSAEAIAARQTLINDGWVINGLPTLE